MLCNKSPFYTAPMLNISLSNLVKLKNPITSLRNRICIYKKVINYFLAFGFAVASFLAFTSSTTCSLTEVEFSIIGSSLETIPFA